MTAFKHILCPIDFSPTSNGALVYALALANWYEANLTVLHVLGGAAIETADATEGEAGPPLTADEAARRMRQAVDAAGTAPAAPTLLVGEGRPADAIVAKAAALSPDLLVLGTHGHSGFNRLLLGSVTEKVIRSVRCPVLTVPPFAAPPTGVSVVFKKILCPIDFSPASVKALRIALDLGRQADGCVTVLHTVEYMDEEEPCEHVDFDIRKYREHVLDHARARLHDLVAAEPQTWCTIEEVVTISRAYREILRRAAASAADLIVMGAQGAAGIDLMLYGSNTQHVVRASGCPVLTVRA